MTWHYVELNGMMWQMLVWHFDDIDLTLMWA
jgi:hypothetical protein